jgi:hypothetical protein
LGVRFSFTNGRFSDILVLIERKEDSFMTLSVNNKRWCLVRAVEVTKEFGRGGSDKTPVRILRDTYKVLKDLLEDVNQEEMAQESGESGEQ